MKLLNTSTLLSTMVLMVACGSVDTIDSGSVNENVIHRTYKVEFDAATQELAMVAQFRVGGATGTTVRLEDPSRVLVDSNSLKIVDGDKQAIRFSGTYYERTISTPAPATEYQFEWVRGDGNPIRDFVPSAFPIRIKSVEKAYSQSRDGNLTVMIDGRVDDRREFISARIVSEQQDLEVGQRGSVYSVGRTGDALVFQRADMEKLPKGPAKLYVERNLSVDIPATETDGGAYYSSKYKIEPAAIEIGE